MGRHRFSDMNCAIAQALDQIGDWWTLLILREAFYGTASFSDFQRNLGVARNILTDRLNQLVEAGILERNAVRAGVERYRYILTPKGADLLPVLVSLMQWGDRWVFGPGGEPIEVLDARGDQAIGQLAVRGQDGRALSVEDLRFRAGPGAREATRARFGKD